MEEIKQISWKDYQITSTKYRKPLEVILKIAGVDVLTKENFSVVAAPSKTKKTFFTSALASAFLKGDWCGHITATTGFTVGWADTEQAQAHAGMVYDRINYMAKTVDGLDFMALRGLDPNEQFNIIDTYIKEEKPNVLIIDGIADLIINPNDIDESAKLVSWLMKTTQENRMHIICILHVNYDSPKLRGHLGSMLERRCEHTMLLTNEMDGVKVNAKLSRGQVYNDFRFEIRTIDNLAIPITEDAIEFEKITGLTPINELLTVPNTGFDAAPF